MGNIEHRLHRLANTSNVQHREAETILPGSRRRQSALADLREGLRGLTSAATGLALAASIWCTPFTVSAAQAEVKDVSINGGVQDGKARIVIEGQFGPLTSEKEKVLFSTSLQHSLFIARDKHTHVIQATFDILQGEAREIPLTIGGAGEIKQVTGENLQDWSVRQEANGTRVLVLRPRKTDKPPSQFTVTIQAERNTVLIGSSLQTLTLTPPQAALLNGYLKVEAAPELDVQPMNVSGLVPLEAKLLPESLRNSTKPEAEEPMAFRFHGGAYTLPLTVSIADPEARRVVLRDFKLDGQLSGRTAAFTLTATARVKNPKGGSVQLLSGDVALAELERNADWRLRLVDGRYVLVFDKPGEYPLCIKFNAAVRDAADWKRVDFKVATAAMQPVAFQGLAADTQFAFEGAARPERKGEEFQSFLPPDGTVKLAWKEAKTETEGRLFYSAEMLSQLSIGSGMMRQVALLEGKIMQGEMHMLALNVRGQGNVTAVQGASVLSWKVEPRPNTTDRTLWVKFNQPQKDAFLLQVQMQTELGAFPQAVDAMLVQPEGATRFAGHMRVVNQGAVRLEVVQASGLSQISPEQFPENDMTKSVFGTQGGQRFAFRFSSVDFALRVQADNVLPELSVSQVIAYHLGETELGIDGEFELDIREAPLREVILRVPKGYAIAGLSAGGLSDYFLTEPAGQADAELRLVYGTPITGRQIVQLRLERNAALGQPSWALPRIEVLKAKSTRGHVAVSADAGFRLTPEKTVSLTDIATAFFPRKIEGIQAAFRLSEHNWEAVMRVERLPQSIQADAFHLFSIGEGIAYGSSTINFAISGAPVSSFLISLSEEYSNVEFTGKDLRSNWQKTTNGYVVTLNTPVSGNYTLLVTYERAFKTQGDTLTFTGARPMDAQNEQGHTLVVSAYQFQVKPSNVSATLLPLETAEVPAEYRLFFDAPILAAYRYNARPFNLQLGLSPLAQGETVSLIVDRAILSTRISQDGEVLTDVRYFVKNRGNPHFRVSLPSDTTLWSVTVNGATVVPVKDGDANLIPLPQRADPSSVQTVDMKLASRSKTPGRITAQAPTVTVPVLLAEWAMSPDEGHRLIYRGGTLAPEAGVTDMSGFTGIARVLFSHERGMGKFLMMLIFIGFGVAVWRWAGGEGAYRFGPRHFGGTLIGGVALFLAVVQFAALLNVAARQKQAPPPALSFLAPVQQSQSILRVEVANVPATMATTTSLTQAWPVALALVVWGATLLMFQGFLRAAGIALGWTLIGWTALRWPNGAELFLFVCALFLFVHLVLPALLRLFKVPQPPVTPPTAEGDSPAATTKAALLLGGLLFINGFSLNAAIPPVTLPGTVTPEAGMAESVLQMIRVEDKFAFSNVRIHWEGVKGQTLPLLYEPAVLTKLMYPTNHLTLVQSTLNGKRVHQLIANATGPYDIEVQYQMQVITREGLNGIELPAQHGLINRVTLIMPQLDVDVVAPAAVSITRRPQNGAASTFTAIVLAPTANAWIGWKPRSRDVKTEKAVFYVETHQLFTPVAGVIEGVHRVEVRPAQGELNEIVMVVPTGATISDVYDASPAGKASVVSLWRFDPDKRELRVGLNPAQSKPFALIVRSQVTTGPLPFEQSAGLLRVNGAAGQLGSVGVATGSEVQLDDVKAEALSPLNLEDFPGHVLQPLRNQVAGLTLRRAFRSADALGTVTVKASPVEPDVRVETQETLSLSEDRTVLAVNASMAVTRAGIFRVSFVLPTGLDVESINGAAISHWTELKADEGRIITLHLKGKTEGQTQFSVNLAGPGTKAAKGVVAPRVMFREASKQRGQLVIVPEQGMRLQVATRDGVTQLDPQKSGIRQKGVLVFRLLQPQWALGLDIEQVDAWVQVTGLQHVTVSEAQVKVAANLQYQIENTGLKALRVQVPVNAEGVRFKGEQVADFLVVPNSQTNSWQVWEVKLHRRIIGKYMLQAGWQTPVTEAATNTVVQGIQALDANLQRGFVTVQSSGRLQVQAQLLSNALQPAEWQSIPRVLLQDIPAATANLTYRLVEPGYQLVLQLERHEATKLLPARVNNVTLSSVISDEGVMLTQVKMDLVPGDKRLLNFTLPKDAQFWFAFVNQKGVWPWRDADKILLPLEQQSKSDQPTTVELFYSSRIGKAGTSKLDLSLHGPKFDLPLENIVWQVYLNTKWELKEWGGTMQLQQNTSVAQPVAVDAQSYLANEMSLNREKTRTAEQMLSLGNQWLEKGDPQQARRAFQSAYGLSGHDNAFNEDARVQLHNLKLQQALVGLNVRQSAAAGDGAVVPGNIKELRNRKELNYSQQEAKQIIEANTADDNAVLMRLAERIVQQQDAVVPNPVEIRATIPQQGRMLTFRRSVQVDTWTDLTVELETRAFKTASMGLRAGMLGASFVGFMLVAWVSGRRRMTNV
ncbi:MAG TPA: hypothetical protein VGH19_16925 [Verrucomicrobiae bacterium]